MDRKIKSLLVSQGGIEINEDDPGKKHIHLWTQKRGEELESTDDAVVIQ